MIAHESILNFLISVRGMPGTVRLQFRRGTFAGWAAADPVLAAGEMGLEIDTYPYQFKIGNGILKWSEIGGSPGQARWVLTSTT